jgi:hypothetical protein
LREVLASDYDEVARVVAVAADLTKQLVANVDAVGRVRRQIAGNFASRDRLTPSFTPLLNEPSRAAPAAREGLGRVLRIGQDLERLGLGQSCDWTLLL